MVEQLKANALVSETSPYLLQHAYNPVQWYPWNEQALQRARQENKPILLSIGYSACHWCHVMAHESFEDEQTAELMNTHFINIKIDREERPDLDRIYQTAQYLLNRRSGGWPLTMFLTPDDHVPFFGGTYFPPVARHGLPGFRDLLTRVAAFYQQEMDAIRQQNTAVLQALQQSQLPEQDPAPATPGPTPLLESVAELDRAFDEHYGGFGGAPKFPTPVNLVRLLHHSELGLEHGDRAKHMALHTLRQMAAGGIYDQIAGGFCRYSVDHQWMIPHFEKMLYDNGQLLSLYAAAWHITHEELFRRITLETAAWMMREMQSPEGGFYSSLDADSEGVEGKFYTWTPDTMQAVLDPGEYDLIAAHFGLDQPANFEGQWHLYVSRSPETIAAERSLDTGQTIKTIESASRKLLETRNQRVWPGRDDKILTAWNALAIKGLASAAIRLQREDLQQSAQAALAFIHDRLWQNGRLLVTCKDGQAHLNAYLDDYAYLLDAVLTMLQVRWSGKWLAFAVQLADTVIENFYDTENNGFFFTSHDHETLIQRRKDFMDDAIPAGNGVVAQSLATLGYLIGEHRYTNIAQRTLTAALGHVARTPSACNSMLLALEDYLYPPRQIILRGEQDSIIEWHRQCLDITGLRTRIYAIPDGTGDLPGTLGQMDNNGANAAFICEGFHCLAPFLDLDALTGYLKSLS